MNHFSKIKFPLIFLFLFFYFPTHSFALDSSGCSTLKGIKYPSKDTCPKNLPNTSGPLAAPYYSFQCCLKDPLPESQKKCYNSSDEEISCEGVISKISDTDCGTSFGGISVPKTSICPDSNPYFIAPISSSLGVERNCCGVRETPVIPSSIQQEGVKTPPSENQQNPSYNYTLLEKIPGSDSTNLSFSAYLSAIYKLAIWIVGLCALFMFLIGAFMYMLAAANTSKMGSAKEIMQDALIGLLLALTSYLILYVINPDLVNLRLPTVSMGGAPGSTAPVATSGAPLAGSGSGCGGLSVSGISNSQCNDASQPLSDMLACIHEKYPGAKITSISDSAGFETCKNNWSKPTCAHAATSCHYGGGSSQKSSDCNKSHAADFSIKNASGGTDLSIAESLKQAGRACGGRVNDETSGPHPHIHISDQTNCCSL